MSGFAFGMDRCTDGGGNVVTPSTVALNRAAKATAVRLGLRSQKRLKIGSRNCGLAETRRGSNPIHGTRMRPKTPPFLAILALVVLVPSCGKHDDAVSDVAPRELPAPGTPGRGSGLETGDTIDGSRGQPGGPLGLPMPGRETTVVDAKIVNVTLSKLGDSEANTIGSPTNAFRPHDTVYAEVESNGSAPAYNLYAKWLGADGMVLADYGIQVNQAGPTRTVISLSKPDGWPVGDNRIELAINGAAQRAVVFSVH